MATARWHDWDRRLVGWFLCALVVLVILVGDPRGESDADAPGGPGGPGGPGAPASVSPARLCGVLDQMAVLRDELVAGSSVPPVPSVAELRATAVRAREVGVRVDGLGADARAGLDFFTAFFVDLPDQPTTAQLLSAGAPASITDQAHADAFVAWLQGNCPAASGATAR